MDRWIDPLSDVIRDRIDERMAEAEHERLARAARSARAGPSVAPGAASEAFKRRLGLRLIALGTSIAEGTAKDPPAQAGGRA